MNLAIQRTYKPAATTGQLQAEDLGLVTIEEPWLPNPIGPGGKALHRDGVASCVPVGTYTLEPHNTKKHPDCWALVNPNLGVYHWSVPEGQNWGRCAVLIHVANSVDQIEGCIGVGMYAGIELGKAWIYQSAKALDALRAKLRSGTHTLTITESP